MLARACLSGRMMEVARGDALMAEVSQTYRRLLDDRAIQLLATFALAGERGAALPEVAEALGVDLLTTQLLVCGLAHGGVLEEPQVGRLIVVPRDLRYPLVKDVFLDGAAALPLVPVLSKLEDPTTAADTLIGTRRLGAAVEPGLIETLLDASKHPDDLASFAGLGEREAERALEIAPGYRRQIAVAALASAPKIAVKILLDSAVGDSRPRHSNPDHPIRELEDFISSRYVGIATRFEVMGAIEEWLAVGGSEDIALEAMCLVIRPAWEEHESDPGRGMTITFSRALVSLADLRSLAALMDRMMSQVCKMRPESYQPITRMIHEWCFPQTLTFGGESPDPAWIRLSRRAVRMVIERLSSCAPDHIGLIASVTRTARNAGIRVRPEADADFQTLYPRERDADWKTAERRQGDVARQLARKWQSESPSTIAKLLSVHEREAQAVGLVWPRWTPFVCSEIADETTDGLAYVQALVSREVPADLVEPFLMRALAGREIGTRRELERLMGHSSYAHMAMIMVLRNEDAPEDLIPQAVAACSAAQGNALDLFSLRDQLRAPAVPQLLAHPDTTVARAVAVGMRDHVPPSMRALWEETIVRCPADDYWYSVILKREPGLLARWLVAYCERDQAAPRDFEHIPHTLSEAITELTQEARIGVLRALPTTAKSPWLDGVIRGIVGDDVMVYEELLKRQDLKSFHSDGLAGHPLALGSSEPTSPCSMDGRSTRS